MSAATLFRILPASLPRFPYHLLKCLGLSSRWKCTIGSALVARKVEDGHALCHSHREQAHCQLSVRHLSDNESDESVAAEEDESDPEDIRVNVYPDSDDPVIKALNRVSELDDVMTVLGDSSDVRHLCQAAVAVWDIHKLNQQQGDPISRDVTRRSADFRRLVDKLLQRMDDCDDLGLVCSFYSLSRLGYERADPVIAQFSEACFSRLPQMSLPAFSRLGACVSRWPFWPPELLQPYSTALLRHIQLCASWAELRQLCTALAAARQYVGSELAHRFAALAHRFILHHELSADEVSTLHRIQRVLNTRSLRRFLAPMYCDLVSLCVRTDPQPDAAATARLGQGMVMFREAPPAVERLLVERALALLDLSQTRSRDDIWLVYMVAPNRLLPQALQENVLNSIRSHLETLKQRLDQDRSIVHDADERFTFIGDLQFVQRMLNDLRPLRLPEHELFWTICLTYLQKCESAGVELDSLGRVICSAYFSQALERRPAARHGRLEAWLRDRLQAQLRSGCVVNTYNAVQLAAFLVAYSERQVSEPVLDQLLRLAARGQLTTSRIRKLSRAVRIVRSRIHHMREPISAEYMRQITQLTIALNRATEERLETVTSVGTAAWLAQSTVYRRGVVRGNVTTMDSVLRRLDQLMTSPHLSSDQLTSQSVEMLATCLSAIVYRDEKILAHLCRYIVKHRDHVTGAVAERVLAAAFHTGYWPEDDPEFEDFTATAADIITRSVYRLTAESTLRACLSLCLYGQIPAELARAVLGQAFLDRTEREIQDSRTADTTFSPAGGGSSMARTLRQARGNRLRRLQMEVNRAIRLNLPDQNIPWFTDVYAKGLPDPQWDGRHGQLLSEVQKTLVRLAGGDEALVHSGVRTAGYQFTADLVVHRLPDGSFSQCDGPRVTSVAVLVPSIRFYCINTPHLTGPQLLRQRHLEILGFTVRTVHPHHWNSMALAEPADKLNFLRALLDGANILESHPL